MTPEALITTPLGVPGSGRVRYGAAMALWREARLSAGALEVFRICSARDGDDPRPLLMARGLADEVPPPAALSPASVIARMIDETDRYLAALPGPGIAEVRAGIAQTRDAPVTPPEPWLTEVVEAHLPVAVKAIAQTHPALARAIADVAPLLHWVNYDAYPAAEIGEAFRTGHAFASLIGGGAPVAARDFDLGLFLIAPHVLYRDHCHRASELYAPLTGPHGWRFGPGAPLVIKPAHVPVWNEPFRPHLTKVGPLPFLALFCWARDVNEDARVLPAPDWAQLEALRLSVSEGDIA